MLLLKPKKFAYIGDSAPEPDTAFLKNLQAAILHTLARHGILTGSQAEKCIQKMQDLDTEST